MIFAEVPFSHAITCPESGKFMGTVVNGRIDHAIGRVLPSPGCRGSMNYSKRRFRSLLLVVEAKTELNLTHVVVYLAFLHWSRRQHNRTDATVYGVISDGCMFQFVTITHDGRKCFDTADGDIVTVLGCSTYVLGLSASMSPNVTPQRRVTVEMSRWKTTLAAPRIQT